MKEIEYEQTKPRSFTEIISETTKRFRSRRILNPETGEPYFFRSAASDVLEEELSISESDLKTFVADLILNSSNYNNRTSFSIKYLTFAGNSDTIEEEYFDLGLSLLEAEAYSIDPSIEEADIKRYNRWDNSN